MAKKKSSNICRYCCGGGRFWAWIFILLGVYFIAVDQGWIARGFPWWAILLIIIGIYQLQRAKRR